jgi:hypothetical protein
MIHDRVMKFLFSKPVSPGIKTGTHELVSGHDRMNLEMKLDQVVDHVLPEKRK